jgi:orotate phosphoribosyltransferase
MVSEYGWIGALVGAREGHFRLESGHHGRLWLELESLFADPARVEPYLKQLARQLAAHGAEAVCGPLTGGAFAAQVIARELTLSFTYSAPTPRSPSEGLYTRAYQIPESLAPRVCGRRVVIVDDVINAGSATRATLAAVKADGGQVVAAGALLTLGEVGTGWLADAGIPVETLDSWPNPIWAPASCPLCAAGTPLDEV